MLQKNVNRDDAAEAGSFKTLPGAILPWPFGGQLPFSSLDCGLPSPWRSDVV